MRIAGSTVRGMLWTGILVITLSGCGSAPTSAPHVSPSTPALTSRSKTPHKHRAVHIKGIVTAITPQYILVKTTSGTVWTVVLSSRTHYRHNKGPIKSSAIVAGSTVMVLARHKSSRDIARVIRLL